MQRSLCHFPSELTAVLCICVVLLLTVRSNFTFSDVAKLARASVSGDEAALDMFSWKGAPLKMGPQEGLAFYISTADGRRELDTLFLFIYESVTLSIMCAGKVHCVDEHCKTNMLFTVEGAVKKLIFLEKREALAVITDHMMLSQYSLGPEGGAQEFMKVALK